MTSPRDASDVAGSEETLESTTPNGTGREAPGLIETTVSICPNPVFVIGSPRSGTSVLPWALAHHPDLWTSAETEFIHGLFGEGQANAVYDALCRRPTSFIYQHGIDHREFLGSLGLGINALISSRSEGKRWVDQSPGYTTMAWLLGDMFPGASFIHLVRDGRAVVNSMLHFGDRLNQPQSAALPAWATDFDAAVRTWRQYVEFALDFCARNPDRTLTVRNEDLLERGDEEFGRIFAFLGVGANTEPAHFVRTSVVNSSFGPLLWKAAEEEGEAIPRPCGADAWESWTQEQRDKFDEMAGELLVQLGYSSPGRDAAARPSPAARAPDSAASQISRSESDPIEGQAPEVLPRGQALEEEEEPTIVKSYFPPGHYYSPVPDLRKLADEPTLSRVWPPTPHPTPGLEWRDSAQADLCTQIFARQDPISFPRARPEDPTQYYGANGMFSPLDAWILQALLRHLRPARMIEIGSGFSSLMAAQVNREFLDGSMHLTCIEPHPRSFLLEGVPGVSDLIVAEAQDVPLDRFDQLGDGDVLFVDTSHAVKTGGELPWIFGQIIPRLEPGVVLHIHDIYLPGEYPKQWVLEDGRNWNENYLVQAFLAFNSDFEVLFSTQWMIQHHRDELLAAFPDLIDDRTLAGGLDPSDYPYVLGDYSGSSLWLRRHPTN